MKCLCLIILSFVLSGLNLCAEDKFYGSKTSLATLVFSGTVERPLWGQNNVLKLDKKTTEAIKADIQTQIKYIIGEYGDGSNTPFYGSPAAADSFTIELKEIRPKKNSLYSSITYLAQGKMVFSSSAFFLQDVIDVPLVLPLVPATFFTDLTKKKMERNCATSNDVHSYNHFYYWGPFVRTCTLSDIENLVMKTVARAQIESSTLRSFPEYDLLYKKGTFNPELKISLFMGYIEKSNQKKEQFEQDAAFANFTKLTEALKLKGLDIATDDSWIKMLKGVKSKGTAQYKVFSKNVLNKFGEKMKITLEVLLSNTDVYSGDGTFHYYLKRAFKESDIVIYDGHAGLGANLSPKKLPFKLELDPHKYQIFYFNSCSSFPYYNLAYFDKKEGTDRLEIITSGLTTMVATSVENSLAFLSPFLLGEFRSYQNIVRAIEKTNLTLYPALVSVNGDEDNIFEPKN